jgi:hypothetical protein
MARKTKRPAVTYHDDDGVPITEGCTISFAFGIPPVCCESKIEIRDGEYWAVEVTRPEVHAKLAEILPYYSIFVIKPGK